MKITMTGATGLIGRRLMKVLAADGHALHVLSRHAGTNLPAGVKLSAWDPMKGEPSAESLRDADAVIHLAGEPIAQRWDDETKRKIRESRVTGTRNLVQALSRLPTPPAALICSSAIGYYGSRGDEVLTEDSAPGSGYLPEICVAWEKEAMAAAALGMRVVPVRTGIVLDPRGGALKKMLTPFRLGVGGKVGSGRQWMSWIHLEDLAGIFRMALQQPLSGPVNGVSPNPVENAEFTRALAGAVKRPAIFPVPAFGLKLLFGEMSSILLGSQRVQPQKALSAGYQFRFPQLAASFADLLR